MRLDQRIQSPPPHPKKKTPRGNIISPISPSRHHRSQSHQKPPTIRIFVSTNFRIFPKKKKPVDPSIHQVPQILHFFLALSSLPSYLYCTSPAVMRCDTMWMQGSAVSSAQKAPRLADQKEGRWGRRVVEGVVAKGEKRVLEGKSIIVPRRHSTPSHRFLSSTAPTKDRGHDGNQIGCEV